MATFEKRGSSWRAQVKKSGIRRSATFDTKAEAVAWAATTEAGIIAGKRGAVPDKSFGDLLEKYADEVSSAKRGERWERMRIGLLCRDELAKVKLADLAPEHFAGWRDRRLRAVSAASVRREWTLISHALNVAVREWRWLPDNPIKMVRRPAPPRARDRRISADEIERLLFALGYDFDARPTTATARVGAAFLFALETAMRAGEIAGLTWNDVDLDRRFLRVLGEAHGGGKTLAARRDVPLSSEAVRILRQLGTQNNVGNTLNSVFCINTRQLDALFRKAKARAMIDDMHFHDTRHEAITRLAKRLDVLELARMVGHRDLRQLMVYYNATAEELAGKLE